MPRIIEIDDVIPGDVLLCRDALTGEQVAEASNSKYAHAAICSRSGIAAEASGMRVKEVELKQLLETYNHIAVFRQPDGWSSERIAKLEEFVRTAISNKARFNTEGMRNFQDQRLAHEDHLPQKIEEFFDGTRQVPNVIKVSYFCSELVAAAYIASGFIEPSAAVIYDPSVLAPGHLAQDFTFGVFCGYVIPYESYVIPTDDEFINTPTLSEIFLDDKQ